MTKRQNRVDAEGYQWSMAKIVILCNLLQKSAFSKRRSILQELADSVNAEFQSWDHLTYFTNTTFVDRLKQENELAEWSEIVSDAFTKTSPVILCQPTIQYHLQIPFTNKNSREIKRQKIIQTFTL